MDALLKQDASSTQGAPWRAFLALELEERGGKSTVTHVEHQGPLRVQRPFYPEENGCAHIYLLHPPGGVAGGDELRLEVEAGPRTRCLLTAPAANKLYRSRGPQSEVSQSITVREGALVEWLPQETIAFSGARCRLATFVDLARDACFIGWEITCLGRPAAGEEFHTGRLDQRLEIWREESPLYLDRLVVGEGSAAQRAVWGLGGHCVVGTLLVASEEEGLVDAIRAVIEQKPEWAECSACTRVDGVVTLRFVGPSTRDCSKLFLNVWQVARPLVSGAKAVSPRIWNY